MHSPHKEDNLTFSGGLRGQSSQTLQQEGKPVFELHCSRLNKRTSVNPKEKKNLNAKKISNSRRAYLCARIWDFCTQRNLPFSHPTPAAGQPPLSFTPSTVLLLWETSDPQSNSPGCPASQAKGGSGTGVVLAEAEGSRLAPRFLKLF
uniref:Uncharacterized protein n=1 Tax=Sphaerodactylus townsendi TaxID=933632 RepID=A0ACB8EFQ5_9SAUR